MMDFDKAEFNNAISVGLCHDVVNIFNMDDLIKARNKYMRKYNPSNSWELIKEDVSFPWQYYHHVLYAK